ncbi:MAG: hypothetical protein J5741_05920 [Bacteroidales bacterium]|nr:hypothetical protein [Bacteroidales bacterium]
MIKFEKFLTLFIGIGAVGRARLRHHPDALDRPRMVGLGLQRHQQPLFRVRTGGNCGSVILFKPTANS